VPSFRAEAEGVRAADLVDKLLESTGDA